MKIAYIYLSSRVCVDRLTVFSEFWKCFVASFILHISKGTSLWYERLNRETLIGRVVLGVALFQHEKRRSRHTSLTLIHCSTNNRNRNSNLSTGSLTLTHTHTHTLTCPTFAFSQTNVSYTKASSGGNSLISSTLIVTVTLLDSRGLSERSNKVLSMNQISENWKNIRHISYLKREKIGQIKNLNEEGTSLTCYTDAQ